MIAVDSNVLLRVPEVNHPHCTPARNALPHYRATPVALLPQNLAEFYVVATRPNTGPRPGHGMRPATALQWISFFRRRFVELRDPPNLLDLWLALMHHENVLGTYAYDGRIAAACRYYGITELITFNLRDFKRYTFLHLIDPKTV